MDLLQEPLAQLVLTVFGLLGAGIVIRKISVRKTTKAGTSVTETNQSHSVVNGDQIGRDQKIQK